MKTQKIVFKFLTNSEHFQFHTECKNLINTTSPDELKIEDEYENYLQLYQQEDEVLKKIVKSEFTEPIRVADQKRDTTFRGMTDINKGMLNHFQPEIQTAATRLQIVFNTYGNLAQRPYHQETADIYNLIQDLRGKYIEDVKKVGIENWVDELDRNNKEFDRLINERYDEAAARTTLVLREVRQQVDNAYRTITERVEALSIVEKLPHYDAFIHRLNVVISTYNNLIAQLQGKSAGKKNNNDTQ